MLRLLALALLTVLTLLQTAQASTPPTIFLDPLNGDTSLGSITGTNTVSFSPTTAVFSSPNDGIMYPAALFPAEGVIEVRLRVDAVGAINPAGVKNFGTIIDSGGADGRLALIRNTSLW